MRTGVHKVGWLEMTDRFWPGVGPDRPVGFGVGADMGSFRKGLI